MIAIPIPKRLRAMINASLIQFLSFLVYGVIYELKIFFHICLLTSLPNDAIDSVKGIDLGHASTQFCAFPQELIPPFSIRVVSLSSFRLFPVGCILKSLT